MPTNENKLKQVINAQLIKAVNVQSCANKELVEAKDVAEAYLDAIRQIKNICDERKRY